VPTETDQHRSALYALIQRRKMPQVMRMTLNWVDWAVPLRRQATRNGRVKNLDDVLQAVLYAEGANVGLKNMADHTPGMSYMQLARAAGRCFSWDALLEAHSLIFNQFNQMEIAQSWGTAEWSASDGMLIPLPMRAFMGRFHPKAPRGQRVVNFMSWLYDRMMSYSFAVIQTTAHEAMHEFDGIFHRATRFLPRKHTTDTAGASDLLFGTGALFDIFYIPIIRDFDSQVFYYLDIKDRQRFGRLGSVLKEKIHWNQIENHWDALMDYAAVIEAGQAPPSRLLSKLEEAGQTHNLHRALMNVGRLEKTIVELSYAGFPDLRRAALRMHNKQEHHHSLKSQVFWANKGEMRLVADQDIQNRHACLELLSSLIVFYNAAHLQAAWRVLNRLGGQITFDHIAHIYPTHTEHINFLGDFVFANDRDLQIPMDQAVREPAARKAMSVKTFRS
jgi:TnpA family transposase